MHTESTLLQHMFSLKGFKEVGWLHSTVLYSLPYTSVVFISLKSVPLLGLRAKTERSWLVIALLNHPLQRPVWLTGITTGRVHRPSALKQHPRPFRNNVEARIGPNKVQKLPFSSNKDRRRRELSDSSELTADQWTPRGQVYWRENGGLKIVGKRPTAIGSVVIRM